MDDDVLEEPTLPELLTGFASDVETFFTVAGDYGLDADTEADLVRKFEEIAELIAEARKIVETSSEDA